VQIDYFQSNIEGELIDKIQELALMRTELSWTQCLYNTLDCFAGRV
jgi:3-dehydroquinate dehydratase